MRQNQSCGAILLVQRVKGRPDIRDAPRLEFCETGQAVVRIANDFLVEQLVEGLGPTAAWKTRRVGAPFTRLDERIEAAPRLLNRGLTRVGDNHAAAAANGNWSSRPVRRTQHSLEIGFGD